MTDTIDTLLEQVHAYAFSEDPGWPDIPEVIRALSEDDLARLCNVLIDERLRRRGDWYE